MGKTKPPRPRNLNGRIYNQKMYSKEILNYIEDKRKKGEMFLTIEDILLDLKDIGIRTSASKNQYFVEINTYPFWVEESEKELVNESDVIPVVDRICDYLKMNGYKTKVTKKWTHDKKIFKKLREKRNISQGKIYYVRINWY